MPTGRQYGSRNMVENRLLLIGGSPRSGTTALLQVLNSNRNAFISSEENLLRLADELAKLLNTRQRRSKVLEGGMRALSPRETLNLENIHSHNFDVAGLWPTIRFIYEHHHKRLHPGEPLLLWGDKVPGYAQQISRVGELPEAYYIQVTRNPFDVVNSMLRRLDAASQGKDWWKSITDFQGMLASWSSAFSAVMNAQSKKKILHIHYEELVFNFDRCIGQINEFLGLDLAYQNLMVADRRLHYDRAFLTPDMIKKIGADPVVRDYISLYGASEALPDVAASLQGIPGL